MTTSARTYTTPWGTIAGISTVFVGRVESLRNQPTINSMQKLAKGLDARLSDLIREAEALAKR